MKPETTLTYLPKQIHVLRRACSPHTTLTQNFSTTSMRAKVSLQLTSLNIPWKVAVVKSSYQDSSWWQVFLNVPFCSLCPKQSYTQFFLNQPGICIRGRAAWYVMSYSPKCLLPVHSKLSLQRAPEQHTEDFRTMFSDAFLLEISYWIQNLRTGREVLF